MNARSRSHRRQQQAERGAGGGAVDGEPDLAAHRLDDVAQGRFAARAAGEELRVGFAEAPELGLGGRPEEIERDKALMELGGRGESLLA